MIPSRLLVPLATIAVAGCMPEASPPPMVDAPPAPPPTLSPAPPPAATTDWRDVPETQGKWSYRGEPGGSVAAFGLAGSEPAFLLRCDRAARQISLSRAGGAPGPMTIKTSYGERSWPAGITGGRAGIALTAADPFLDQLAFSRGRFSVALDGLPLLMLPAWAEPARVIEDCRL